MRANTNRTIADDLAIVAVPTGLVLLAMLVVGWSAPVGSHRQLLADTPAATDDGVRLASTGPGLKVVGPVAVVSQLESGLDYLARVDTGALRTSLHADDWTIVDDAGVMHENIGKTIRFRATNRRGGDAWVEAPISGVANVRTSEGEELRYLVDLTLNLDGVERTVEVTLNDRSRMTYALLLGRNYLKGAFAVDVSQPELAPPAGEGALLAVGG